MNCFNRLRFTVLTCVLINFLLWKTVNGLEGKCYCADSRCKEPISLGRGTVNYHPGEKGVISFKKQSHIKILWKGIDSNDKYWGIEVDGRRGYVPKIHIHEDHVLVKRESLIAVDIPLPAATPPNKDPTQATEVKSMDIKSEFTTTPPNKEIIIPIDKGIAKSDDLKPIASPVHQTIETAEKVMLDVNTSKPDQNFQVKESIGHKNIKTEESTMPKAEVKDKSLTSTATTAESSKNETITTQASTEFVQGQENPTVNGLTSSPENDVGQNATIGESGNNQGSETTNQRHGAQNSSPTMPKAEVKDKSLTSTATTAESSKNETITTQASTEFVQGQENPTVNGLTSSPENDVGQNATIGESGNNQGSETTNQRHGAQNSSPTMPKAEVKDKSLTSTATTAETSKNETITTQASTEFVQGQENPTVNGLTSSPENDVGQNATIGESGNNQGSETTNQRHGAQNSSPTMPKAEVKDKSLTSTATTAETSKNETITTQASTEFVQGQENPTVNGLTSSPENDVGQNATIGESGNNQGSETTNQRHGAQNSSPTMPKAEVKDKSLTSTATTAETSKNETITTQASTEFVQGQENPTVNGLTSSPENDVGQNATIGESGNNQGSETTNQRHGAQNSSPTMPKAEVKDKSLTSTATTAETSKNETITTQASTEFVQGQENPTVNGLTSSPENDVGQNATIGESGNNQGSETTNQRHGAQNSSPTMPKAEVKDKSLTSTATTAETSKNETITTQASTEFVHGKENPTVNGLTSSPENYVGQNATIGESGNNQGSETTNQRHGAQNSSPTMPKAEVKDKSLTSTATTAETSKNETITTQASTEFVQGQENPTVNGLTSSPENDVGQNATIGESGNNQGSETTNQRHGAQNSSPTMPKAEVKDKSLTSTATTAETSKNETITTQASTEFVQGQENPTVNGLTSSPENDVGQNATIGESGNNQGSETTNQRHGAQNSSPTMPKAEVKDKSLTSTATTAETSKNETITTQASTEVVQGQENPTVNGLTSSPENDVGQNATIGESGNNQGSETTNQRHGAQNSSPTMPKAEVKDKSLTSTATTAETSKNETITTQASTEFVQGQENPTVNGLTSSPENDVGQNATIGESGNNQGSETTNQRHGAQNSSPTMPKAEVKDKSLTSTATTAETSKNETITTQASTEFVQGQENPTVNGLTSSPENDVGQNATIGESGNNQGSETTNPRHGAQNSSQVYGQSDPTPAMEPPALFEGKNIPVDKGVPQSDDTNQPNAYPVHQTIETAEEVMLDVNTSKHDQNSQVKESIDHKNIKTKEPTMPKAEAEDKPLTSKTKTDETSQNEIIKTAPVSTEFVQGKENPTVKELAPSPENDVGQNTIIEESPYNETIETLNLNHGAPNMSMPVYRKSNSSIESPVLSKLELSHTTSSDQEKFDSSTLANEPEVSVTEQQAPKGQSVEYELPNTKNSEFVQNDDSSTENKEDKTVNVESVINQNEPVGKTIILDKNTVKNPESFEQQSHVARIGHEGLIVNQSHNNRYDSSTESKTLGKIENHENSGVGNSNQPQSLKLEPVAETSYIGIAKQTKDQSEDQSGTQTENEKTTTDGLEEQSTESYTQTQVDWHGKSYTTPPIVSSDIPQTQNARNMVEKQHTESSEEKVAAALDSVTDLPRLDTESVPIVLPSIWTQELEGVKQQQGLFATILETVNSFLSSDKKEPVTADVQDNELHRILYPEKQNEAEYYKKVQLNSCSSEDDRLADSHPSSASCKRDAAKITMNSFAEDLAASILNISDVLACLAVTAASALVFIFGYYCFCNSSREGTLLAKLNLMERSLLATHKENAIIKHELLETRGKLSSIEDNSFGANEMVMALKKELEAELVEKQKSQEQVANLEKELENAAEAGLELNKIVSDLLSNQTGDESIISSVEELQKQLNEQQHTILEINANLAEKSRENSDLHLMIAEQNVRLTGEIASLQQDNDELEAEKSNLQTRLNEIKDEFQEDLTKALEGKNLEIQRLQVEIAEFKTKCEDQYTKWQTSVAKIEALEDCLKSIKKDPKVNIKDLIDSVNVRAEIIDMQKQRVFLKDSLEAETDAKNLLEDQVKIARAEIEKLKYDFNQSEKDKLEAQTRLEVLSNYFKEKETQLQKELSLKEAMWLKQQGEKTSTVDRLTSMQAEIQSLKSRNDSLHAEIEAQLAAHKAQTGTLEHRAHETWLAARQSERRCEEARAEAAALRRKLTALAGGNLNEGTLDAKMGTDAPSPIQLDTSEPQLLGRMPPPPFLPPPFIGTAPPFMGMPPPFLPSGPIRPPPLGRLMSPPPPGFVPAHANHMRTRRYTPPDIGDSDNYDDDEDVVPHRVSRWYSSQSPYRSHSPDSRYTRDLMSTYDTETDYSPPPSSRDRRSRESRAGSFRAYSPQPLASSPINDDGRKGKQSTANKGSTSIQKHFHENDTSSDSGSASGNSDPERLRIW